MPAAAPGSNYLAVAVDPAAHHAPAAATAAVVTLTPSAATKGIVLSRVGWSYSAAPTAGSLTISWNDGSARTRKWLISGAGPGSVSWPVPLRFPANVAVTVTLASGAGAVVGTADADAWET